VDPSSWRDRPCDSESKLSTEATLESEGESSVILKLGLKSPAMEVDRNESWSDIEMTEPRLSPVATASLHFK
jgi:hypothetical protein